MLTIGIFETVENHQGLNWLTFSLIKDINKLMKRTPKSVQFINSVILRLYKSQIKHM